MRIKSLFRPRIIRATRKRGRDLLEDKSAHLRVAAYARVSTDSEEQLHSYQSQIEKYERIIKEEHKGQWELVKIYADEAKSGLVASKRPGYQEMLRDCREGKIDLILCKQISRFGRNLIDILSAVYELRDLGVEIYFELDNIFGSSSDTELVLSINSAMAQEESRLISRRVSSGQRENMKAGRWEPFFRRIVGYAKDVDHNMVHRILSSEKYYGMVVLQKTFTSSYLSRKVKPNRGELDKYVYSGTHPKVINPGMMERVEKRRESLKAGNQPKRGPDYTLPVVYCSRCGERLCVDGLRENRYFPSLPGSLTCIPKSKLHGEERCHQGSVNYNTLSSFIAQYLRRHCSFNPTSLERKARRLLSVLRKVKPTRIRFQAMETDAKLRQTRLALQKAKSLATENPSIRKEAKYADAVERLRRETKELSQRLAATKEELSSYRRDPSDLAKIRESLLALFSTNKFMMDYALVMGIGMIETDPSNYVFMHYEKETELTEAIERLGNGLGQYRFETYETTSPKRKVKVWIEKN